MWNRAGAPWGTQLDTRLGLETASETGGGQLDRRCSIQGTCSGLTGSKLHRREVKPQRGVRESAKMVYK